MVNDKKSVKLVLVYTITKAELGGAQRHVYELIGLLHHQYKIHLIVGSLGWLADECKGLGVSVHHLPTLTRSVNMLLDILAIKEFINLIRQIEPDIIHAHSGKPGVIARLAGAICQVPVIFTAHGWGFDPNAPKLRSNAVFVVEKLLAPLAAKIICVCESDRQLAIKLKVVNSDRVITIHNGIRRVDALLSTPATNPPQLIMVARFNKQQKDQHTFMKAIKILNEEIKVLFIGTGPDWEETKHIAQDLDILSRVSFLGDRLDVDTFLAKSQIFVLTTHYEGLPISILEAMRAGLPVIATNVNGISEQVVDGVTGLLVPHKDVNALVKAITTLINDPDLRCRMGREGAKKLTEEFTVEQMLAKTKLVYQSIIKSN